MTLCLPRNTCSWKLAGTDTFRLASKKLLRTWGTNIQNPSKRICQIYLADDGKLLIQPDQSGAEALIVAYLCRKGLFRELFLQKIKSHVFVALHVFADKWQALLPHLNIKSFLETPIADLRKKEGWKELENLIKESDRWEASRRYYFIAKMICHASNYGMKSGMLQMHVLKKSESRVALTKLESETFLGTYHNLFPELHEWHKDTLDILKSTRTLRNLFGFPRYFNGFWNDELFKKAYAFVPQSTVGTITNIAFTNAQNYIEDNGKDWDLLNNKHDSILMQAPIDEVQEAGRVLKGFMEQDLMSFRGEPFKMRSEVQFGTNWAPYDEHKNPLGMKELVL